MRIVVAAAMSALVAVLSWAGPSWAQRRAEPGSFDYYVLSLSWSPTHCARTKAEADPDKRYWAAIVCGIAYIAVGLISGAATAFIAAAPPILIQAVAGLALMGAFGASASTALNATETREAAVITFIVTASGIGFFGVPGAFWGLVAGIAMHLVNRLRLR